MGLFGLCAISENKSFGSAERFVRYCAPYTRTARVQKAGGRSSNQNQERFDVFPRLVEVDAYLPHMGYSSRVHHLEHYVLFVSLAFERHVADYCLEKQRTKQVLPGW